MINIESNIKLIIEQIDKFLIPILLNLSKEEGYLITFSFHALFHNENEVYSKIICPHHKITVSHFQKFINHFIKNDYKFISPKDILKGLNPYGKYVMLTFDDGYYNNRLSLPVIKNYKIPVVFFISIDHVLKQKCFWWDVLYRERKNQGYSDKAIYREMYGLTKRKTKKIENFLKDKFGEKSFNPISDIDRPFTKEELIKFSKEKYVYIGNHTKNHAILTNYSLREIKEQISYTQKEIFKLTNKEPLIIAYPNGEYSAEIINISEKLGLKLGITADYKKNKLPINFKKKEQFKIGRFILDGNYQISTQCKKFRANIGAMKIIKSFL